MKAIEFERYNTKFAENQEEYLTLPAHVDSQGEVTTCWRLTIGERIRLLLKGRIYLRMLTFKRPLQPVRLQVEKPKLSITRGLPNPDEGL
jgi:hypothetical protein